MPANVVAAASLVLAMLVATIGTICQVDSVSAPCRAAECAETVAGMAPPLDETWQASLERALHRTERGLLQMAGLPETR